MDDAFEGLRQAIRAVHGCESEHSGTFHVREMFGGQVVWDGDVEEFHLRGHPKASTAYAWTFKGDDGKERSVAVLKLGPVDSPLTAVRAAIVARSREGKPI